jgi:hypothetical protein
VRGEYLLCPACRGRLLAVTLDQVDATVHVCDGCRAVWFDWFDGESSALAQHLDTHAPTAPAVRAGEGACPRDGATLVEQPYLDAGPRVWRCQTCLGLFAPRERIAALQAFHARMPDGAHEPIVHRSLLARLWNAFAG